MIGLCSTIICHRFSSPLWWKHLKGLIALDDKDSTVDWFDKISKLRAGEGVVFCPLALGVCFLEGESKEIQRFGRGCLIVKVRRKMTATTGKSVLSQDN
jgi:hypothetical protein